MKITAFNREFNSLKEVFDKYNSEKWCQVNNYNDFTRIIREYKVNPEIALSYKEEEIILEQNIVDETQELLNQNDNIINIILFKEDICYMFKYFIYKAYLDSSLRNVRNLNILFRKIFYGDSYIAIGNSHCISKERTRQIVLQQFLRMRNFFRVNNVCFSFDLDKLLLK